MFSRVVLFSGLVIAAAMPCAAQGRGGDADRAPAPSTAPHVKSLYERLGGAVAINDAAADYTPQIRNDFNIPDRDRPTAVYLVPYLLGRLCKTDGKKCLYGGTDDPPLKSLLKVSTPDFEGLAKGLSRHLGYHGASPADAAEAERKMHEVEYFLVDKDLDLQAELDGN